MVAATAAMVASASAWRRAASVAAATAPASLARRSASTSTSLIAASSVLASAERSSGVPVAAPADVRRAYALPGFVPDPAGGRDRLGGGAAPRRAADRHWSPTRRRVADALRRRAKSAARVRAAAASRVLSSARETVLGGPRHVEERLRVPAVPTWWRAGGTTPPRPRRPSACIRRRAAWPPRSRKRRPRPRTARDSPSPRGRRSCFRTTPPHRRRSRRIPGGFRARWRWRHPARPVS